MTRFISILLTLVGILFFVFFFITFLGSLDGGRYQFLEIILAIIWGVGSMVFLIPGIFMFRNDLKTRQRRKEEQAEM